jgi:hypothetical protein
MTSRGDRVQCLARWGVPALLALAVAYVGCVARSQEVSTAVASASDDHLLRLIHDGHFGAAPQKLGDAAERTAREHCVTPHDFGEFLYGYYEGYETALENPHLELHMGTDEQDLSNQGVRAGRAAALEDLQTDPPRVSLVDFGFSAVDVPGSLHLEFEDSELVPDGLGERWWVTVGPAAESVYDQAVRDAGEPRPRFRARVVGYLHPRRGLMGHLNQYDRAVVVTKIVEITKQ